MNANLSILVQCCGQLGEVNLSRPTGPKKGKPLFSLFFLRRGVTGFLVSESGLAALTYCPTHLSYKPRYSVY